MNGDDLDKLTSNIMLLQERLEQLKDSMKRSFIGIIVLLIVMFIIGIWFGVRVI